MCNIWILEGERLITKNFKNMTVFLILNTSNILNIFNVIKLDGFIRYFINITVQIKLEFL